MCDINRCSSMVSKTHGRDAGTAPASRIAKGSRKPFSQRISDKPSLSKSGALICAATNRRSSLFRTHTTQRAAPLDDRRRPSSFVRSVAPSEYPRRAPRRRRDSPREDRVSSLSRFLSIVGGRRAPSVRLRPRNIHVAPRPAAAPRSAPNASRRRQVVCYRPVFDLHRHEVLDGDRGDGLLVRARPKVLARCPFVRPITLLFPFPDVPNEKRGSLLRSGSAAPRRETAGRGAAAA